jgi:hypothetical protein
VSDEGGFDHVNNVRPCIAVRFRVQVHDDALDGASKLHGFYFKSSVEEVMIKTASGCVAIFGLIAMASAICLKRQ